MGNPNFGKKFLQSGLICCTIINALKKRPYPPVAKLDIAVDSDSKGRGFESLRAGQKKENADRRSVFSFFSSEGFEQGGSEAEENSPGKIPPQCGGNVCKADKGGRVRQTVFADGATSEARR